MSLRMLVYLFTVELDCYPEGSLWFLIIGCTVASRTWRHRACVRLSGGDAATQARGENYTERGDVVLDGDDHIASALGHWKWVKYDCLAVLGGCFSERFVSWTFFVRVSYPILCLLV